MIYEIIAVTLLITVSIVLFSGVLRLHRKLGELGSQEPPYKEWSQRFLIIQQRMEQLEKQRELILNLLNTHQKAQQEQRTHFDQHQISSLKLIQESLQQATQAVHKQVSMTLTQHTQYIGEHISQLTQEMQRKLQQINEQVDKRLNNSFEKTTATFHDVVTRLTIIDQAQKKISELSGHMISLQEILTDKRSRGAFGEVQLNALIRNMIPESHVSMQHTLSNGKRVDCLLLLPKPTGSIAIDAKFPLETYRQLTRSELPASEHSLFKKQFRIDIRKHIQDIAQKYIIPGETAEGAILFIPAEAVFAEIHANFPDLVDYAHQNRVWLSSPTTMMAILTTVQAVLKDEATRQQIHVIQDHLLHLNKDFARFQKHMDKLARHVTQAHDDIEHVHKSSQKISKRFAKIEQVDLELESKPTEVSTEVV